MTLRVVPLAEDDVIDVVSIHLSAFPGFFLSFLGPRFLKEFYHSFLVDPAGIGFVAREESGRLWGVVVGPLTPVGYFKRLFVRRWWAFAWAGLGAIARRPSVAPRLLRALAYRGGAPPGSPRALLSSVAVAPQAQGKGVGRALVERWVEEVRVRGGRGCYLTTDADGNEPVNRFYLRSGWSLEASYSTAEGRRMNRYVLDFAQQS